MIYDERLFALEDQVNNLVTQLLSSEIVDDYVKQTKLIKKDQEVTELLTDLNQAKKSFEKIADYGKFAPDFTVKRRELRKKKRKVDVHPIVSDFKVAETSLQNQLDYMALDLAQVVSPEIKVDAGNPFFEFANRGCGGNCHV
ncbi:YlbF family regulator [Vagococcus sp.]|uniref:YlbF family regulator n=1 Tax=Vagococcus sp. TaxID=1933889 RepID=UPI003F99F8D0